MITSAVLLLTGLHNGFSTIKNYDFVGFPGTLYPMLVVAKLFLALGIMWISATLSGRSATAVRFREKLPFWVNLNAILLIALICIAGLMRVSERTLKAPESEAGKVSEVSQVQL